MKIGIIGAGWASTSAIFTAVSSALSMFTRTLTKSSNSFCWSAFKLETWMPLGRMVMTPATETVYTLEQATGRLKNFLNQALTSDLS